MLLQYIKCYFILWSMPTFVFVQASFVSYSRHICILLIKCWPADLHKWVATVDCVKLDEDSGKGMALF